MGIAVSVIVLLAVLPPLVEVGPAELDHSIVPNVLGRDVVKTAVELTTPDAEDTPRLELLAPLEVGSNMPVFCVALSDDAPVPTVVVRFGWPVAERSSVGETVGLPMPVPVGMPVLGVPVIWPVPVGDVPFQPTKEDDGLGRP